MSSEKKITGPGGKREGAGRKLSYTREKGAAIVDRIANFKRRPEVAAAECGVSPSAFLSWFAKGRDGSHPELAEFFENVTQAKLIAEGGMLDVVLDGDEPGHNRAKLHLEVLGRTNKHYSQKVQVGVQYELERILDVVARVCGAEDFERVLAELVALDSQIETSENQGVEGVQ